MVTPRLSIILPVYKVEKYLEECLHSIYAATSDCLLFEVILVNDGTPDDSMRIARKYSEEHSNLQLLEQENQGLSAARMNGLSIAKGEYVWFVDSDDYLCNSAIATVLDSIQQNTDVDVFLFPLKWTFTDHERDYVDFPLSDKSYSASGQSILKSQELPIWASQRFVIKKSLFNHSSLYFPTGLLHEDEYFGRVLLYLSDKIMVMNSVIYYYRQRQGSITAVANIKVSYDLVNIYRQLMVFSQNSVSPEDRFWFNSQCSLLLIQSYLKNKTLFGTTDFSRFMKENGEFIRREFNHNSTGLPRRDRLSGKLLLRNPRLHLFIKNILNKNEA